MHNSRRQAPLNEIQLGKKLSYILRHGALEEGLPIAADGFVSVPAILRHRRYASHYTLEILQSLVAKDNKQRYQLRLNPVNREYEIRANQGHSLQTVRAEQCLEKIQHPEEVSLAVHGTYHRHWAGICAEGLRRMKRNHIHFATTDKPQVGDGAVSGFRDDCQLLIYLDVHKAMVQGGMELFRSSNNVILCSGTDGRITKEYFAKVVDRRTGSLLNF